MRQRLFLPTVFILLCNTCWSQTNTDSTLFRHQAIIDSYISSLDTLKLAIQAELSGNLVFGDFRGSCLYDHSNHKIYKIQFDFDTTSTKIIYFKDNKPIKIIDNHLEFYNIEQWVDKKGIAIESSIIDKFLLLAKESINVIPKILD